MSLQSRLHAAQYIDNGTDYAREMEEIRKLQTPEKPRLVIVPSPVAMLPRKTVAQRLSEQAAAKLATGLDATGKPLKADLVKFLTAMVK